MKPLRVCHIIHDTKLGGTETMLCKLLQHLVDKPLELSVISLMNCGEIGQRIQQLGVPVYAMGIAGGRTPRPDRLLSTTIQLKKLRPDVVQTWSYHADLCGGLAARMAVNAPVIWNVRHATLDPAVDSKNVLRSAHWCGRISKWLPDRILLNAHAAVDVHKQAGYDVSKMQVVPNGFDTEHFKPLPGAKPRIRRELGIPDDAPLVGMCGRFHPHKGQHDFVKVAAMVVRQHPRARFLIAGTNCDTTNTELVSWLAAEQLTERVHLLGVRHDMPQVLNALDLYLLPSVTEAMPNVVGEAMACGVPCVVTDVGDAKQLLSDCGQVVPPGDVPAIAKAVSDLLAAPASEKFALSRRAWDRIREHFDIQDIAAKYATIWRQAAQRDSTSRRPAWRPTLKPFASADQPAGLPKDSSLAEYGAAVSKIKLVHVTTIPMTQWLFLRGQNDFMKQHGFEVHAVSSPGPHMPKLQQRDRVHVHRIPISRHIRPMEDVVSAFRLWRLFRRLRPEIVQVSTPKAALLGAVAAWAARVPIRIYQVRGLSSESEAGWKRALFQRLEQITAALCNGCLVNAQSLLKYARQARILTSGLVAGIGTSNGVDLTRFDPAAAQAADMRPWIRGEQAERRGPVIGYVGRMTRDKGLEDLFEAWTTIRSEFPTARLLLVGPWESQNAVSPGCRDRLEMDRRVLIVGSHDDVVPFYKAMDIFVFPSHGTEGFPNAPLEAAAMGLPVIATRVVGSVDAVVEGVTGRIVSPRAPDELGESLRSYLSNPALRSEHGRAGQERVRTGFAPLGLWAEFRDYYIYLLRREGLAVPTMADRGDLPKAA